MSDRLMSAVAHASTLERVLRVFPVAPPGAGAQWTFPVPGQTVARVRAITATYTPSAVAGTRQLSLRIDDQTTVLAALAAFGTIAASQPTLVSWVAGAVAGAGSGAVGVITTPMPDLVLPPGHRVLSVVAGGDVGDTWTNVTLWIEELLSQPFGVEQYREAIELGERLDSSPFLSGGM